MARHTRLLRQFTIQFVSDTAVMDEHTLKQLEAHFEEARALAAEINVRLESQERLTHYTVLIIVGAVTVIATLFQEPRTQAMAFFVLLCLPLILVVMALRFMHQHEFIQILASYLFDELRPKVNALLQDREFLAPLEEGPVWNWTIHMADRLNGTRRRRLIHTIYGISGVGLTYLVGASALAVFVYEKAQMQLAWTPEQQALVAIDLLGLSVILVVEILRARDHPLARAFSMMRLRRGATEGADLARAKLRDAPTRAADVDEASVMTQGSNDTVGRGSEPLGDMPVKRPEWRGSRKTKDVEILTYWLLAAGVVGAAVMYGLLSRLRRQ